MSGPRTLRSYYHRYTAYLFYLSGGPPTALTGEPAEFGGYTLVYGVGYATGAEQGSQGLIILRDRSLWGQAPVPALLMYRPCPGLCHPVL